MKTIKFLSSALALAATLFLTLPASALTPKGSECANNQPGGGAWCADCIKKAAVHAVNPHGVNPFYANGGNVGREIPDLQVFGGVGDHQLHWTRQGFSRANSGTAWFGQGHNWRHNYQWEMTYGGFQYRDIYYPDGAVFRFTKSGGVWKREAACPDNLTQSGTDYILQTMDGYRYHFISLSGTDFQCKRHARGVWSAGS